jgi:heavy metal response regulator
MRALVVEDDSRIASFVVRGLREQGYAVDVAEDGLRGEELALTEPYDIIVLDILLPGLDGRAVLRSLRSRQVAAPVIMLTAVDSVKTKVDALDAGADDYLTKPFSASELMARIRSIHRRHAGRTDSVLRVADLMLDPVSHQVRRGEKKIDLTAKEFSLLHLLMENAGHPVTRTMIIEKIWNRDFDSFTNVVDVHVSRLRGKVDREFAQKLIRTIKGVGYALAEA